MKFFVNCFFLLAPAAVCLGSAGDKLSPEGVGGTPVSNISAECRNGQVFLTWDEPAGNSDNLRVYMSDEQITALSIDKAVLLTADVEPNSGHDWLTDPAMCPRATGPARGWIIEQGAAPLSDNSGLFVHTVGENDPKKAFFAVLGGKEQFSAIQAGVNSLETPVEISAGEVQAISQSAETIAFKKNMPLVLYLHPHTSRPPGELTHLFFADKTMGWREGLPFKFKVSVEEGVILVEPYDRVWINRKPGPGETTQSYDRQYKNIESWWYGTSDAIGNPEKLAAGVPTNYTERILVWIIGWVQKTYQTDPNRVYGFGVSMGTGIQRFALHNPGLFASIDVLVPILDLKYEIELEEGNIKRKVAALGPLEKISSDGMPLAERFNLVDIVCTTENELPFMIVRVGRQDFSVGWKRKPDYIRCMQERHHGILAAWDNKDHVTSMRDTTDPWFPEFRDYKWYTERFALNKSYPAFSNFSLNDNIGSGARADGDLTGFINYGLDWDIIKDKESRYEAVIKTGYIKSAGATVDITPRRTQLFKPKPGSKVMACNQDMNGKVIEKKTLTVDARGDITYEKFALTNKTGHKLTLVVNNQ